MELSTFATYVGLVRDFVILGLLLIVLVAILVIYRKITDLVDSTKETVKNVQEITGGISGKFAKPAVAGAGVAVGAGKAGAFLLNLIRRRRTGGNENGE